MTRTAQPRGFVMLPRDVLVMSNLSPTAKLVFAVIRDAMRGKGKSWPGIRTICSQIGMTDKPVSRAIRELEHIGMIRVTRDGGKA